MFDRFFFGWVALLASLPAYVLGGQDRSDAGSSGDAAPTITRRSAVFLRFFFGRIALAARLLATGHSSVPDVSLVAAPTPSGWWLTMSLRFLFGTVALSAKLLTSRACGVDDDSLDAAPTITWRPTMPDRFFSSGVAVIVE